MKVNRKGSLSLAHEAFSLLAMANLMHPRFIMQDWRVLSGALFGLAILCAAKVWQLFHHYILKPWSIRKHFLQQGIIGPPALPVVGNMLQIVKMRQEAREQDFSEITHDIVDHVLPDLIFYSKKYGKLHFTWFADEPRLNLEDLDMVNETMSRKAGHFGRTPLTQRFLADIIGNGLVAANGEEWAHSRRIVSPAFQPEKLKVMVGTMAKCTLEMVEKWNFAIDRQGGQAEFEVLEQFTCLAADVISRTAFGSSYEKGKRVFELMNSLQLLLLKANRWPGGRLLPTVTNVQIRNLKEQLNYILEELVQARQESANHDAYGNDLLGLMLTEAVAGKKSHGKFGSKKLIEECKTFYIAGHETITTLLAWTLMLLAKYPLWQELCRKEVQEIGKGGDFDAEMLGKLKIVTMVINESSRLYPPAAFLHRGAMKNIKVGKLLIPEGVNVTIPILAIHHDPSLWGPDVNEFNPNRFANGVSNACKHPMGFMPFGAGLRICVGQLFAMMEAKIALATILSHFKFQLSPSYRHNPTLKVTLRPHHGVPIIFNRL